jgi:hypothetical protein
MSGVFGVFNNRQHCFCRVHFFGSHPSVVPQACGLGYLGGNFSYRKHVGNMEGSRGNPPYGVRSTNISVALSM